MVLNVTPREEGRPNLTPWECPHNVLPVTPRDIPCRHLEDVFCRRYEAAHMVYQRPEDTPQRRPEDVLNMSLYDSISKGEKRPRDKYFVPRDKDLVLHLVLASINVIILKWIPQHSGLRIRKEGIWITYLKLNIKTHVFLSSKVLSISIYLSSV